MLISGEVPVKTYASMPSQTVGNGKEPPFIWSTRDIKNGSCLVVEKLLEDYQVKFYDFSSMLT